MNAVTDTYNTRANRRALSQMDTINAVQVGPALVKLYTSRQRTTRRFTVYMHKRSKSFVYPYDGPKHYEGCQRAITGVLTWIDMQQGGG